MVQADLARSTGKKGALEKQHGARSLGLDEQTYRETYRDDLFHASMFVYKSWVRRVSQYVQGTTMPHEKLHDMFCFTISKNGTYASMGQFFIVVAVNQDILDSLLNRDVGRSDGSSELLGRRGHRGGGGGGR